MVKAMIFDVFGTVVDWRSGIATEVGAYFSGRGVSVDAAAFADAWRGKYQPAMAAIRDGKRGYIRLDVLHRENLDATLADFRLDGEIDDADRTILSRAWEKLPPWPDSVPGLTALKRHYAIAPCSNGSISLMTWLARFGGLPWDCVLGAEIARDYKPQLQVYRASAEALGLQPAETMMVAAHNADLEAAREAGLKTGFFPRPLENGPNQPAELEASSDWDVIATDMEDLARQMNA